MALDFICSLAKNLSPVLTMNMQSLYFCIITVLLCPLFCFSKGVPPIIVRGTHFEYFQPTALGAPKWLCATVELQGGPMLNGNASTDRFNSNIIVAFSMATESPAYRSQPVLKYYRSKVRLPALEIDERVYVRFFLPPEIVRRDELARVPAASLVELSLEGTSLPFQPENATGLINSLDRLQSFKATVETEAPKNDGLLLPLHLTPFYNTDNLDLLVNAPTYLP